MSGEDFDYYVSGFTRCDDDATFIGRLNSYRAADRNWELGAPYAEANIDVPALFIASQQDIVLQMIPPDAFDILRRRVPDQRGIEIIDGTSDFVQMEEPQATNLALLNFLASLRGGENNL